MACDLMGAGVLITLGVLFLLSTWAHVSFHYTWPVILIVIGLVKFLQASGPTTGHIPPPTPSAPAVRTTTAPGVH
jgi:LiaI-LiaF-like transmembrane region